MKKSVLIYLIAILIPSVVFGSTFTIDNTEELKIDDVTEFVAQTQTLIDKVQYGEITIATSTTSTNFDLNEQYDLTRSSLILLGVNQYASGVPSEFYSKINFVDSDTVNASRWSSSIRSVVVNFVVVQWSVGITKSIQRGDIAFAPGGGTSTSTTISSVDTSNSVITYLGNNSNSSSNPGIPNSVTLVELTDSTTVTLFRNTSASSVGATTTYEVIEFNDEIVNSAQPFSISMAAQTGTASISPVDLSNSVIFWRGLNHGGSNNTSSAILEITDSTTVTATRVNSSGSISGVNAGTVIEFNPKYLNGNAQRGRVEAITPNTTGTTVIDTSLIGKSLLLYNGSCSLATGSSNFMRMFLESSTTISSRKGGTANNATSSYSIIQSY